MTKQVERLPFETDVKENIAYDLTENQSGAKKQIEKQFVKQDAVLLFGVTSSGKTQIYIKFFDNKEEELKEYYDGLQ